ncbi:hypothetical protein [Flagellimonas sp.]|uniref:hypothetical protein n=1 Tax=Flagellimonas sp. TaxID=2058762 RepID=UPI003BABF0AD
MPTSAVKLLFTSYQTLTIREKKELYRLIKEERGPERLSKIAEGEEVEFMDDIEIWAMKVARELRKESGCDYDIS